jgi:hypothetical protein
VLASWLRRTRCPQAGPVCAAAAQLPRLPSVRTACGCRVACFVPRRSGTRVRCAMAECRAARRNPTDALEPALLRDIFGRLPADQRARAACVSCAWRDALADPALWRRLDLTARCGVACRVGDAALRAAAARARGSLEALDVSGHTLTWHVLCAVAAANAASLRELRVSRFDVSVPNGVRAADQTPDVRALLSVAPGLQLLQTDVLCRSAVARSMLRGEPPWEPLRLRRLALASEPDEETDFPALAAELIAHPSLTELLLHHHFAPALAQAELDALAGAALALRLTALELDGCRMAPDAAPALARMLSGAALAQLRITRVHPFADYVFLDAPAAALLAAALRANTTLRELRLPRVGLWNDVPAAVALLGALTGHASLRLLDCSGNFASDAAAAVAVGTALAALVAADAPALEELYLSRCGLGDAGLGPLCDALPRNAHLRTLKIHNNGTGSAFAVLRLLPAARANTSLRELNAGISYDDPARQHVRAREAARAAAEAAAPTGGA